MTGKIVSAISNLLRVAPDDKHSSFLGVLYGKFLIISAIVFCLLWPVFGAMPALNAAWGFSFLVLVFYEWLFSRAVARDQINSQRLMLRAGCAVFRWSGFLFRPFCLCRTWSTHSNAPTAIRLSGWVPSISCRP